MPTYVCSYDLPSVVVAPAHPPPPTLVLDSLCSDTYLVRPSLLPTLPVPSYLPTYLLCIIVLSILRTRYTYYIGSVGFLSILLICASRHSIRLRLDLPSPPHFLPASRLPSPASRLSPFCPSICLPPFLSSHALYCHIVQRQRQQQ
ncbi:hypothetical protein F4859DRAFT_310372 [Xylaria cf. heliscus]|nr:hypothetical protein F4859DRAFT_310372 [Xylaria cf. heliscus]